MENYWKEEDFSNAEERSVFDILQEHKGERVASCWHCCLKVLRNLEHPELISVAAYCLREVMDGVGLVAFDDLSNYTRNLRADWEQVSQEWTVIDSGEFDGNVKNKLLKFLQKCKETFDKLDRRPKTKDQMMRVLEEADPSRIGLPPKLSRGIGDELVKIRKKVTQILHGKKIESRSNFMEILERFEKILISRYQPKTFERQAEIDELIKEAESHD